MRPSEVLLVEDNAGDALLVGQAMAACPVSVNLHIARDGEQALQMLKDSEFAPALVILDLNIPKISGYGVLAAYPLEQTPVVVFTASQNELDVDRAFSLDASGYIKKPMDLEQYKNAVCGMVQKWVSHE
jgi:chemotaxis family two-component system response regulator Rcp1